LKKSGLPKDVLKSIWIMSAQTDPQFLERDEFYLALRFIALAQNNMEVSEEVIRINHPIPPLPKIDLKSASQPANVNTSSMDQSINMSMANPINVSSVQPEKDDFTINEEDDNKYTILFNKNKDFPDKISLVKTSEMFIAAKIPSETLKKIFEIIQLADSKCMNIYEFKVVFHLIYRSYVIKEVPIILPNSLKYVLSQSQRGIRGNEIDFMQSSNARIVQQIPPQGNIKNIIIKNNII
jgi:epidermal growth factor receptor substrate 15